MWDGLTALVTRLVERVQAAPLAELEALVVLVAPFHSPKELLTTNGRAAD